MDSQWSDTNRFRCPKDGQLVVFPEERNYQNLFLYLEDIEKAEKCDADH